MGIGLAQSKAGAHLFGDMMIMFSCHSRWRSGVAIQPDMTFVSPVFGQTGDTKVIFSSRLRFNVWHLSD
jgi:hypothetical protein